jgi:hypothetical protein
MFETHQQNVQCLPVPFFFVSGEDSESGLQSANDGNPFLHSANDETLNLQTANE